MTTTAPTIPSALTDRAQWVCWNEGEPDPKTGKRRKIPKNAKTGRNASSTNPATWSTYQQAADAARRYGFTGVGYVFTDDDPHAGVDLDDCRDPATGAIAPWAQAIINDLDSYAEVSPSKTGVKLFVEGVLPKAVKTSGIELYDRGRYFTVTGWHLPGTPTDVRNVNGALSDLYRRFAPQEAAQPTPLPAPRAAPQSSTTTGDDRREKYGKTALAGEITAVSTAREGTRNNTLNSSAFRLGQLVAAGLLDEHQVAAALQSAATAAGLPNDESIPTIQSGLQAGIADGAPDNLPDFDAPSDPASATPSATPTLRTVSRGFVLKCIKEEEAGDAQLFVHLHQGRYVYDRAASAWYEFAGHVWHRQAGPPRGAVWATVASYYLALAAKLQAETKAAADEEERRKLTALVDLLHGRAKALQRLNRINNVLTLAGDMGMLGIVGDEWDCNPWLLAAHNGIIDLRTGQLRDGKPDDYICTQAPTAWRGLHEPAPRWERFISEVMSHEGERVTFLHQLLGYALNGTTREHILVLLIGERGRNGKGVLFETLSRVLGDYAGAVPNDVVVGQDRHRTAGSAQPHLMKLRGKRLAYTSETSDGASMSAAQVKLITGGDRIIARDLYERATTFTPTHTLFAATNRRPQAPADDDALWERVKVLDFKARFVDEPTEADEHQRDPRLAETLEAEASGILAWLVRGHLDYYAAGRLATPDSVKLARDTYRKGESLDPFLEACGAEWDGGDAGATDLWQAYQQWCAVAGLKAKTQHWFGRQLAARFEKTRSNEGRIRYIGVSLDDDKMKDLQRPTPEKGSDAPPDTEKGSGGVPMRNSDLEKAGFTRFSEPFLPISETFPSDLPHEEKVSENGSKGSEGSDNTGPLPHEGFSERRQAQHGQGERRQSLLTLFDARTDSPTLFKAAEPWQTPPADDAAPHPALEQASAEPPRQAGACVLPSPTACRAEGESAGSNGYTVATCDRTGHVSRYGVKWCVCRNGERISEAFDYRDQAERWAERQAQRRRRSKVDQK